MTGLNLNYEPEIVVDISGLTIEEIIMPTPLQHIEFS